MKTIQTVIFVKSTAAIFFLPALPRTPPQMVPGYYVWYLPRRSRLAGPLRALLQRLLEAGLVGRLYHTRMEEERRRSGARAAQGQASRRS